MDNEIFVSVSMERYQQLIRAEQTANMLLALVEDRADTYSTITYDELKTLRLMLIGKKEEE